MRRSHEDIASAILKSCASEGASVSQLMARQNLPYKMLISHLNHLTSIGLVRVELEHQRRLFFTTERGTVALRCYRNAIAMLNGNPTSCPLLDKIIKVDPKMLAVRASA